MSATATLPTIRTARVVEFCQAKPGRVDREAGVIHGVKILGLTSANNRDYTRALRGVAGKYEGRKVFIGHPKRSELSEDRHFGDWAGVLRNVHEQSDGLYGDVVLRREGRSCLEILEAAERFSGHFGLSHVADTKFKRDRNGVDVVESIGEVFSVDLVCEPATTNGLFESRGSRGSRLRELEERLAAVDQRNAELEAAGGARGVRVDRIAEERRQSEQYAERFVAAVERAESRLAEGGAVAPAAGTYESRFNAAVARAEAKLNDPAPSERRPQSWPSSDVKQYANRFDDAVKRAEKKLAAQSARNRRSLVDALGDAIACGPCG